MDQKCRIDTLVIEVDLTVDSSSVLQRRMLNGELDIVIRVEGIDSTKIVSSAVASYPVRWIARRGLLSKRAAGLAAEIGLEPVYLGPLKEARLLEPLAMAWILLARHRGLGRDFALNIVRRADAKSA